jgi:protein SCO1/2
MAAGPAASRLADIGPAPPTVLVDSAGKRFDVASLRGKVVLVSFIFTTCNGVCPVTTQRLSGLQAELQKTKLWGNSVAFVSIALDPKRDTPEVLARYARLYKADPAAWHFVTGPPPEVERIITAWGMWVKTDATGVLDHPSRIFLLDPVGRQREIYNLEFLKSDSVMQDVRLLLDEHARPRVQAPASTTTCRGLLPAQAFCLRQAATTCRLPSVQQKGFRARRIEVASGYRTLGSRSRHFSMTSARAGEMSSRRLRMGIDGSSSSMRITSPPATGSS